MQTDDAVRTIAQKRFLRGMESFTIDGHTLKIERRYGLSLVQKRLDLDGFHPEPLRIKRVPLGKMLVALIGIVVSVVLLTTGITAASDRAAGAAMGLGLLLAIITFCIAVAVCFGFENVVVFQNRFHQIRLRHNLPDEASFDRFVAALSDEIRQTGCRGGRLLEQLRVANIIDDEQYNQAVELFKRRDELTEP